MFATYKFHFHPRSNHPPKAPDEIFTSMDGDECVRIAHEAAQEFFIQQNSINWSIITMKAAWMVYNFMSGEVYVFYACIRYEPNLLEHSQNNGGVKNERN